MKLLFFILLLSSCDQGVIREKTSKSILKECNTKCQDKFKVDAASVGPFGDCYCKADE